MPEVCALYELHLLMSTGRKVRKTFRLLKRVKKHFKGFHKNCAKKKS